MTVIRLVYEGQRLHLVGDVNIRRGRVAFGNSHLEVFVPWKSSSHEREEFLCYALVFLRMTACM